MFESSKDVKAYTDVNSPQITTILTKTRLTVHWKVFVSSPLDAAEGVLISLLGLDLKVKGSGRGGASGEVDTGDLLEAKVHGGLVDVDEASLQRVEEAWGRLVGAGDALSARVTVEERGASFNNYIN